jgi:hypothetical protein
LAGGIDFHKKYEECNKYEFDIEKTTVFKFVQWREI